MEVLHCSRRYDVTAYKISYEYRIRILVGALELRGTYVQHEPSANSGRREVHARLHMLHKGWSMLLVVRHSTAAAALHLCWTSTTGVEEKWNGSAVADVIGRRCPRTMRPFQRNASRQAIPVITACRWQAENTRGDQRAERSLSVRLPSGPGHVGSYERETFSHVRVLRVYKPRKVEHARSKQQVAQGLMSFELSSNLIFWINSPTWKHKYFRIPDRMGHRSACSKFFFFFQSLLCWWYQNVLVQTYLKPDCLGNDCVGVCADMSG